MGPLDMAAVICMLCRKGYDKKGLLGDNVLLFVPNIIDYIRIIFLSLFAYNASIENFQVAAMSYATSVVLDELDGCAARYLCQTSLFGMMLDILVDEASVLFLCMLLGTIYPQYIILFQLHTLVDIAAQWTNYMYAAMYRNNDYSRSDHWIMNVYFNKPILTNLWVYGNHVFLLMLYLCHFTDGPQVFFLGSSCGLWKLLAYLSAPWSISRLAIMLFMLITSLSNIAHQDRLRRCRQFPQNGGSVTQDDQGHRNMR